MRSFTTEADRNCMCVLTCSLNCPVCRSYTATPAVTLGGTSARPGDACAGAALALAPAPGAASAAAAPPAVVMTARVPSTAAASTLDLAAATEPRNTVE